MGSRGAVRHRDLGGQLRRDVALQPRPRRGAVSRSSAYKPSSASFIWCAARSARIEQRTQVVGDLGAERGERVGAEGAAPIRPIGPAAAAVGLRLCPVSLTAAPGPARRGCRSTRWRRRTPERGRAARCRVVASRGARHRRPRRRPSVRAAVRWRECLVRRRPPRAVPTSAADCSMASTNERARRWWTSATLQRGSVSAVSIMDVLRSCCRIQRGHIGQVGVVGTVTVKPSRSYSPNAARCRRRRTTCRVSRRGRRGIQTGDGQRPPEPESVEIGVDGDHVDLADRRRGVAVDLRPAERGQSGRARAAGIPRDRTTARLALAKCRASSRPARHAS